VGEGSGAEVGVAAGSGAAVGPMTGSGGATTGGAGLGEAPGGRRKLFRESAVSCASAGDATTKANTIPLRIVDPRSTSPCTKFPRALIIVCAFDPPHDGGG
jgi:hypothetical protein